MASKIRFVTSAAKAEGYPPEGLPEIAFAGRSNAGKSSLLNALAGEKVAKVSGKPGKTALLNFFDVDQKFVIVDMPGYGYAARSKKELDQWKRMIETYLETRETLKGLCIVMDVRRKWTDEEQMLVEYCLSSDLGVIVVLTKSDKVKQGESSKAIKAIKSVEGLTDVLLVSSTKRKGLLDLNKALFNHWVKGSGD